MSGPEILARRVEYTCPWLEIVVKEVRLAPPRGEGMFYGIRTRDYVAVLP